MLSRSVLSAVFKRNGGEGKYTKLITEQNIANYLSVMPVLESDEIPLIAYMGENENWLIATTKKIIWLFQGQKKCIENKNLAMVELAWREEYMLGVYDKSKYTKLLFTTIEGDKFLCQVESGPAYLSTFNLLFTLRGGNVMKGDVMK